MGYEEKPVEFYDLIYETMKDYRAESERVIALIERYGKPETRTLLDVACGTGLHLQYFKEHYDVEGVDLSPAQLKRARERLPDIRLYEDDMTSFSLPKHYDALTCLFSAIAHLPDIDALKRAFRTMADHVDEGGVVIVEPWIQPEQFKTGYIGFDLIRRENFELVRVSRIYSDEQPVEMMMDYYVSRNGVYDEPFQERHFASMFTLDQHLEAFSEAGLDAFFDPEGLNDMGRGLFIARK